MADKVAVIIVGHNHKRFLPGAIESVLAQTTLCNLVYVDNASIDGSADLARRDRKVTVIANSRNKGYGQANNEAMFRMFADGYEWCLLMNPDISLHTDAVRELLTTYRNHTNVGLVQPVILSVDGKRVNTMGNAAHYLGFGYCPDTGKPYEPLQEDRTIVSVSGACMLVHREFFNRVGGFDDAFFLYNEDQDLSWRGLMQGYTHYVSAAAVVNHEYDFSRHASKWYHSHKNRIMMLLKNYSFPSLIMCAPAFVLTELFYFVYCISTAKAGAFLRAYWYILSHLGTIIEIRRRIQKRRTVGDKAIIPLFDATLKSPLFRNPAVSYVVNPLLGFWYMIVSRI